MGGTSKQTQTTQQRSSQDPWFPTTAGLSQIADKATGMIGGTGLTGVENTALNTLAGNAADGNPYSGQIGVLANDLLGGGVDRTGYATGAYDSYKSALDPFARGDYLDPSTNPALGKYLSVLGDDISNRVNGYFAGAGRDFSGANTQSLSRGLAEGMAPTMLNAYQGERSNQMNAINALYGAGNTTAGILSGLDQTALGNRQAGVGAAAAALDANNYGPQQTLAVEAMRRGMPIQNLSDVAGILGPIGSMGGTGNMSGTAQGTYTKSPVDTALGWANVGTSLFGGGSQNGGLMGSFGRYLNMFK